MLSHACIFFFFNDTATTEIYTLSLHDALPILLLGGREPEIAVLDLLGEGHVGQGEEADIRLAQGPPPLLSSSPDRKSTRLNSSHANISYAVFCLKKKKQTKMYTYLHDCLDS